VDRTKAFVRGCRTLDPLLRMLRVFDVESLSAAGENATVTVTLIINTTTKVGQSYLRCDRL